MKSGYKETPVGFIPDEWEVKTLGNLASIATGNTPPTNDPYNYGDEFLFVGPVDMGAAKFISTTEKMLSRKGFSVARRFPKGSILFVCIGSTIGKCGIAPVDLTSNQQINAIFPSSAFSIDFVFYAVCAAAPRIRGQAGEQAVPIVNKSQFAGSIIAVPPLPEQRAIAQALSDVDALLGALDRLIAKKRDLKQAAMQQLLTGEMRLPGFRDQWAESSLGSVGRCLRGVSYNPEKDLFAYDAEQTVRLLRSNNIQGSAVNIEDVQFVNRDRASHAQIMQHNDILICMANGSKALVGKAGIFELNDGYVYTFGAFMGCFRTDSKLAIPSFIFFLFQTEHYRRSINDLLAGSTINNLRPRAVESMIFPLPERAEQIGIAEVLNDLDAELASLVDRRNKTRAIKQGMMQELLTGRTRLI